MMEVQILKVGATQRRLTYILLQRCSSTAGIPLRQFGQTFPKVSSGRRPIPSVRHKILGGPRRVELRNPRDSTRPNTLIASRKDWTDATAFEWHLVTRTHYLRCVVCRRDSQRATIAVGAQFAAEIAYGHSSAAASGYHAAKRRVRPSASTHGEIAYFPRAHQIQAAGPITTGGVGPSLSGSVCSRNYATAGHASHGCRSVKAATAASADGNAWVPQSL